MRSVNLSAFKNACRLDSRLCNYTCVAHSAVDGRRLSSTKTPNDESSVVLSKKPKPRGPLEMYELKVRAGSLMPDEYQRSVVATLDSLHNQLEHSERAVEANILARKLSSSSAITKFLHLFRQAQPKKPPAVAPPLFKGVYIYGTVGTGKSMLMDMFYDCSTWQKKRRIHFGSFMLDVHSHIHTAKVAHTARAESAQSRFGRKSQDSLSFDPIPLVADQIISKVHLLCFDEFQVTDIADAMILKRLFTELFERGMIMVSTSNRPPDELYKHGLQRSNFIPFIAELKKYCNIVQLNSDYDYRRLLSQQQNCGSTSYYLTFKNSNADAVTKAVDALFKTLCESQTDSIKPRKLRIKGRDVQFAKTCGHVLDSNFAELCARPLGSVDYLQLCQVFDYIIVRNVPVMTAKTKSEMRRFITLVDTVYDNRKKLVVVAEAEPDQIFSLIEDESGPHALGAEDQHRLLMDDLGIKKDSVDAKSNIFTGDEELFAFDRTKSRLYEMQSETYWNRAL